MTRRELPPDAGRVLRALDEHGSRTPQAGWLRERALVIEVLGAVVPVASRDDLIAMKRASGRPIDRGDVIALAAGEPE